MATEFVRAEIVLCVQRRSAVLTEGYEPFELNEMPDG